MDGEQSGWKPLGKKNLEKRKNFVSLAREKGTASGIEIRRAPFLGTKRTRRRKGGQGGAKVVLRGRQENGQRLGKCKTTGGSS